MISESPACSAMYENMVLLQDRLGKLPRMHPSAEFEFGLRSRILLEAATEPRMRHKIKRVLFPTVGRSFLSGAVAAMLALGVSVLLQGDPLEDVTASQTLETVVLPVSDLDLSKAVQFQGAVSRGPDSRCTDFRDVDSRGGSEAPVVQTKLVLVTHTDHPTEGLGPNE